MPNEGTSGVCFELKVRKEASGAGDWGNVIANKAPESPWEGGNCRRDWEVKTERRGHTEWGKG